MDNSNMPRCLLLKDIAEQLNAELIGDGNCEVLAVQSLLNARPGDISFLANSRYKQELSKTLASAVILRKNDVAAFSGNALVVEDPYLAYARLTAFFAPINGLQASVDPSASIDSSAKVDGSAYLGANAVVGAKSVIEADVFIGPGVSIGENCCVGRGTRIYANASLYRDVSIGENCTIHSGAVIGADGFGFAHSNQGWVKIHQLGSVIVGSGVEIGACSTVDRGALGNTSLGDGVILDNHVQIAHNVQVGANTAMAAYTGISGSTVIGENCTFAGRSGAVGHINICAGVHVSAGTIITKSITEVDSYSSGTPMSPTNQWRKNAVRFNQLDALAKRLAKIEKSIDKT